MMGTTKVAKVAKKIPMNKASLAYKSIAFKAFTLLTDIIILYKKVLVNSFSDLQM